MYVLESPLNVQLRWENMDWSASYRRDSTIVAPYGAWSRDTRIPHQQLDHVKIARNKTRQVAWFVSNCKSRNNRLEYARQLGQHINVDIFGSCGDKKCPRSSKSECQKMLREEYKFYLAFENSDCVDYITEKFWETALHNDVIPIVMGAGVEDYAAVAPPGSFIHVDQFSSPGDLAEYLHKLDNDHQLFQEYFQWKSDPRGGFIKTKFFCRVCSMLNYNANENYQWNDDEADLADWWKGESVCKS